ncbi:MAG: hypothetical protein JWN52_113 [Actinomycetia bacterium]|nr:hypothetical protein [Actinomycetes bacterium]
MADHADRYELEDELRVLGREVHVPAAPDLTASVRRRLERPHMARPHRFRARWRVAVVTFAALIGLLAVTPQGRAVVVRVLRFAGVELSQGAGPRLSPTSTPALPGEQRMSLDRARRLVAFPILVPAALGRPDEVVVSDGGRVLSLVYHRTASGQVRVDEFDGTLDPIYFQKFVYAEDTSAIEVNGRPGLWILRPHELMYIRRDGTADTASARLVTGRTIIWDTGRVAVRMEGTFEKTRALAIARSAQ